MKRRTAFMALLVGLLILVGCAGTGPSTTTMPEPESRGAPGSTAPVSETKINKTTETEPETTSEVKSTDTEQPAETIPGPAAPPEPTSAPDTDGKGDEPVLLDTLKRNCQLTEGSKGFSQIGLAVGDTAVNFTLKDINGNEIRLSKLLAEKPVVMITGSFT